MSNECFHLPTLKSSEESPKGDGVHCPGYKVLIYRNQFTIEGEKVRLFGNSPFNAGGNRSSGLRWVEKLDLVVDKKMTN